MTRSLPRSGRMHRSPGANRISQLTLASVLGLLTLPICADTLYRWIDDNGEVQFSDRQPPAGVEYRTVTPQTFAPAPPPPPMVDSNNAEPAMEQRIVRGAETPRAPTEAELAALAAENARIAEKNCQIAQRRLDSLGTLPRVFRENEAGERVKNTEEERQAAFAEARADVEKWCNRPQPAPKATR